MITGRRWGRWVAQLIGSAGFLGALVAAMMLAAPGVATAHQTSFQGAVTSNTYDAAAGSAAAPGNAGAPLDPLKYDCSSPASGPTGCQNVGIAHAYFHNHPVNFLYTANFFCDTAVASKDSNGCEGGLTYKNLPPDAQSQDPLYIPVPLGFKPSQGLQCPVAGNCVDHPATIDLSALYPVLKPILHLTSPNQLNSAPLTPHAHMIFNRNNNLPEWWNVVIVPVTNQAGFNTVIAANSKAQLTKDLGTNGVYKATVPTNVFLYFQVLAGTGTSTAAEAMNQNVYHGATGPSMTGSGAAVDPLVTDCVTKAACSATGIGNTLGFVGDQTSNFLYSENYFCDKSVAAKSATGCEGGASYKKLPPGTSSASQTDPLYIITPLFKPQPVDLQCPVSGYCIDHPATVDLSRLASTLDPILGTTPTQLENAPGTPHSHIVLTTNHNQPEWWNVQVIGVTNAAAYNKIDMASNKEAEVKALQADPSSGVTGAIPTNVFLWFQVLPGALPAGAPGTGGGGTAGLQHTGLLIGGGGAVVLGLAGALALMIEQRRRSRRDAARLIG